MNQSDIRMRQNLCRRLSAARRRQKYEPGFRQRDLKLNQESMAVLRLGWPSILLPSVRDLVATAAETVTASRLWSAMSVKQRK